MTSTILHNPKCSTSRHALELLTARGHEPKVVLYLKDGPDAAELDAILKKMGAEPEAIMRERGSNEAALAAWGGAATRAAKVQALADHPILIERPIVVAGAKAAMVRPKAEADSILDALGL